MCDFQVGTIECRGDGYLWDADDDGYDPDDVSDPCPRCNGAVFLEHRKEEAETSSFRSDGRTVMTGADMWLGAVAAIRLWSPEDANAMLRQIGRVEALVPDPQALDGYRVEVFAYS